MFQAPRSRTTVPTRALVVSRPFATSVLTLSRSTGRDTPEHRGEFGIAGQPRPLGIASGDDVDADAAGDFRMIGMRAPGGNDDETRCHAVAPALPSAERRAIAIIACCRAMKANSRIPVTILVHQLDSVPSKVM